MIASSPSPALLSPSSRNASSTQSLRSYITSKPPSPTAAALRRSQSLTSSSSSERSFTSSQQPRARRSSPPPPAGPARTTVDAATQVTPDSGVVGVDRSPLAPAAALAASTSTVISSNGSSTTSSQTSTKRKGPSSSPTDRHDYPLEPALGPQDRLTRSAASTLPMPDTGDGSSEVETSSSKRSRHALPAKKKMPAQYEQCEVRDLVRLIAAMLMELIRFNDQIPLVDGRLTRFHSRAPPGISVLDYLQRLATHATLSPPLLLSMVYYIDRLCSLYDRFTISSLTVHRFLIASATVASKGLSDLFWTNRTYARVGGITTKELKILELEFLTRMEWRIVPQPEKLTEYYISLISRSEEFEVEEMEVD